MKGSFVLLLTFATLLGPAALVAQSTDDFNSNR